MKGQSFLETLTGLSLMTILAIAGFILLLKGLGIIIATRWASVNSHCISLKNSQDFCNQKTSKFLADRFAFHNTSVKSRLVHGIIHSSVDGSLGGLTRVHGQYDLGPSEYKRTSR